MSDAEEKARLRSVLLARRRALSPEDVQARGARVQARLLATPQFEKARTVALYAALAGEVPTDAVCAAALAAGKTVAFPVVPHAGRCLRFYRVDSLSQLVPAGRLRIAEPPQSQPPLALASIELFVVPGLGFSPQGHRLGQGAGYYDATLAQAPEWTPRVGLAFSEQLLAELPVGPADVSMHLVLTEAAAFGAGP